MALKRSLYPLASLLISTPGISTSYTVDQCALSVFVKHKVFLKNVVEHGKSVAEPSQFLGRLRVRDSKLPEHNPSPDVKLSI